MTTGGDKCFITVIEYSQNPAMECSQNPTAVGLYIVERRNFRDSTV